MARRVKDELIGLFCSVGGLFLALSLVSYDKWDPSIFTYSTKPSSNYGGVIGAYFADTVVALLGLASFALPVFLLF